MAIEFLDQYGNIAVDKITHEQIAELDEPRQQALLTLIDAVDAKTNTGKRMATARKRFHDAVADEAVKSQAFEDSNMVIPFSVSKIENELGRHLTTVEMHEARRAHGVRCREELAHRARQAASAAYVPQL